VLTVFLHLLVIVLTVFLHLLVIVLTVLLREEGQSTQ
jgi:hypothetical protein